MLKIKQIDIFSRKTIKTGILVYLKQFVLSIPLIIPPGFLLQLNLMGWLARKVYGEEQVKFFSLESLSVGWQVTWRYYVLLTPILVSLLVGATSVSDSSGLFMSESLGLFEYALIASFLFATLLLAILATGWAVERVGFIRLYPELYRAERMRALRVGGVIKNSLIFAGNNWLSLIFMVLITSAITEALVAVYGLPSFAAAKNMRESIVLQFQGWFSMVGASLLLALIAQHVAINPSSGSQLQNVLDVVEQLKPRLLMVLSVASLSALIILLGLYLFIPGIIVLIWLFFAVQVSVAEEQQGVAAIFKRSKALATGRATGIALLILITAIPYLIFLAVGAFAGGAILESGSPYSAAMHYVLMVAGSLFSGIVMTFAYLDAVNREDNIEPEHSEQIR